MTVTIIITFCILLLFAYVFDLTSSKTKIPSVILLLLLGWGVRQLTNFFGIQLMNFTEVLPVLGTIGLILIVLEGSLELELNRTKMPVIAKSILGALLPMAGLSAVLAFVFNYYGGYGFKASLINAIPLCIISSAIAIPSVRSLSASNKEFVIYESSISDIIGVLVFNFIMLNEVIDGFTFGYFVWELILMTGISFVATIALSFLISRIEHHIKFIPIILLVILIYTVTKIYHLPGLIFILIFGLFVGNLKGMKHMHWMQRFEPDDLIKEVTKFQELTTEAAFLVRALFFLLFGFMIETSEVLNTEMLVWSGSIVGAILLFRIIQLKVSSLPLRPLLFVAPRGLITILLFLSIDPIYKIDIVNNSMIIQVILMTALLMMVGLVTNKRPEVQKTDPKKTLQNTPLDSPGEPSEETV